MDRETASADLSRRLSRMQLDTDKVVTAEEVMDTFSGSTMFLAGEQAMLNRILNEMAYFQQVMNKRRYFNNAKGIARFREHIKSVLNIEE